jgi:hypothetical protein
MWVCYLQDLKKLLDNHSVPMGLRQDLQDGAAIIKIMTSINTSANARGYDQHLGRVQFHDFERVFSFYENYKSGFVHGFTLIFNSDTFITRDISIQLLRLMFS